MKEFDIIAIGELNIDLILNKIKGFPQIGKEIFAESMSIVLGSSTAIFAANAATLGLKVGIVGMVGNDTNGQFILKELASRGVDTRHILSQSKAATGATVVMTYGDDRANVTYPGAMNLMSLDDIDTSLFAKTRHVHVTAIFMQEGIKKDLEQIIQLVHQNGATISMDTQWDPSEQWDFDYKTILPQLSIFFPNKAELCCLTQTSTLCRAIDAIQAYINLCAVKQGVKGSVLLQKGKKSLFKDSYFNHNLIDATGAGDSFNAGFLYRYLQGKDYETCQDFGNLMGAINTTSVGGISAFESREMVEQAARKTFDIQIEWE